MELPVEPYPMPVAQEQQPEQASPDQPSLADGVLHRITKRLFGLNGEPRYQTWPERVVRDALSAPHDVMEAGKNGVQLTVDDLIKPALDMSALAGTGGIAGAGKGAAAALGSAPFLRPALKYGEKIYKAPVGGQHLDALPPQLADEFTKQAMSGQDISNFNFGFMNHKGQFLNREDSLKYAIDNGLLDPHAAQYGALTSTMKADNPSGLSSRIIRDIGAEIGHESLETLTKPNHFYRGMSEAEYNNTIGVGKNIKSNESSSVPGEGTNFSNDARDAESYANFGRTDPRKTGIPNYLVEIKGNEGLKQAKDGYFKASEISKDRITNIIKMEAKDNSIIGTEIKK